MSFPHGGARTYYAQSILTASPGQLVLMLYDGALRFLGQAQAAFASDEGSPRRIEQINTSILRAQNILIELQSNLDHQAGGQYAADLARLYDYYLRRLLEANLRKRPEPVQEVERLLRQLRDGWSEMLRKDEANPSSGARGVA
jgi:flagellar protein FliS